MGSENEPAKLLLPYLQRADELHKHEPLVAYYCRLYAMERGLKIPNKERTKTTNALLLSLMSQLEKDKKSLNLTQEDNLYVEGFALKVFAKADKQDHAGHADLNTAKTFYAASIFFEILNQFGELAPDLEQKQKYAAWKAADIRKALKEGRKPESGFCGDNDELTVPSISPQVLEQTEDFPADETRPNASSELDKPANRSSYLSYNSSLDSSLETVGRDPHQQMLPPSRTNMDRSNYVGAVSYPNNQQAYPVEQNYVPQNGSMGYNYSNFQSYPSFTESSLPAATAPHLSYYQGATDSYPRPAGAYVHDQPLAASSSTTGYTSCNMNEMHTEGHISAFNYDSNYKPSSEKISEAHKAAKFAVGALAFDDVATAVEYLRQSLELLTNPLSSR